jgi:Tol biopolymer transport system component
MGTSFIRAARTLAFLGLASSAACSDPVDLAEPLLADLILFQGHPAGTGLGDDVYTMAPDGSDLVRLTTFGDVFAPTWSPDGKQIAFARLGSNHNIFVMDADGANIRQVTTGPEEKLQQAWAPDGRSLIYLQYSGVGYTGEMSIRTVSVDGGAGTLLTACECQCPTYSPDGSSIAYVSWVPEGTDPGIRVPSVFLMDADGSGAVNLLPHGMWGHRPRWLPDGSGILFSGYNGSGLAYDVYRMDRDGTDLQRLTTLGSIGSASLSRDGTRLIFDRKVPAGRRLFEMMWLDGTAPRKITDLVAENPRWKP